MVRMTVSIEEGSVLNAELDSPLMNFVRIILNFRERDIFMKKSVIIPALITISMLLPTSFAFASSPLDRYDPLNRDIYYTTHFVKPVSDVMLDDGTDVMHFLGKDDGYTDVFSYYDDLQAKREEAEGLGDAIVAAYSGVITDEEREKVYYHAIRMETAVTIRTYEKDEEALNEVIESLNKRKPVVSTSSSGGVYYSQGGSGVLTRSGGVNYFKGRRETWYSQRVLPGGGLRIPGRHVAADGTIRDADGYICVAASDLPYGSLVETSLGMGKVYDTGCAAGTTDIYTNW